MDPTLPLNCLGKYRIDAELGRGAMGTVYRAHDTTINRLVAVKVLHRRLWEGTLGPQLEARFLQEAQAAARCLHPNIITLFDYGNHDGTPYIVMEYVEGTDLRSFLDASHKVSLQDAIAIVEQVLAALEHAHAKGVVHRDIKPANVMLLDGLVAKVTDFGVARLDTSDLTHAGDMVGTPSYMSPEGLRGEAVDNRSDLYSTGMLLLELVCRCKPRSGEVCRRDVAELLTAAGVEASMTRALARVLRPALEAEPARRYQQASAFAAELHRLRDGGEPAYPDAAWVVPRNDTVLASEPARSTTIGGSWQPELLQAVESGLARFVGPVARVLVRKVAGQCSDVDELTGSLARQIPTEAERREFLRVIGDSGIRTGSGVRSVAPEAREASGPVGASFTPEQLAAAARALAFHMGPMARRLVKHEAGRAASLDELYDRLAAQIASEVERAEFLSKRPH